MNENEENSNMEKEEKKKPIDKLAEEDKRGVWDLLSDIPKIRRNMTT